jgi:hypothetical protein
VKSTKAQIFENGTVIDGLEYHSTTIKKLKGEEDTQISKYQNKPREALANRLGRP